MIKESSQSIKKKTIWIKNKFRKKLSKKKENI